jgi:hypothetical protein
LRMGMAECGQLGSPGCRIVTDGVHSRSVG